MVSDNTDKLTPKQQRTIAALLSAPSIRKASEDAGVPERTVYDWLKLPAFKGAYRDAQRETFKHSIALTQKYLPHAVQTLVKVMADDHAPHSAKVSAASALMKYGRESIELDDVVERVEKLEAAATHGIALRRSWMIGDILDDVEAGERAGCSTVLVDRGNETRWRAGRLRTPRAIVYDFADAVAFVLDGHIHRARRPRVLSARAGAAE